MSSLDIIWHQIKTPGFQIPHKKKNMKNHGYKAWSLLATSSQKKRLNVQCKKRVLKPSTTCNIKVDLLTWTFPPQKKKHEATMIPPLPSKPIRFFWGSGTTGGDALPSPGMSGQGGTWATMKPGKHLPRFQLYQTQLAYQKIRECTLNSRHVNINVLYPEIVMVFICCKL